MVRRDREEDVEGVETWTYAGRGHRHGKARCDAVGRVTLCRRGSAVRSPAAVAGRKRDQVVCLPYFTDHCILSFQCTHDMMPDVQGWCEVTYCTLLLLACDAGWHGWYSTYTAQAERQCFQMGMQLQRAVYQAGMHFETESRTAWLQSAKLHTGARGAMGI